MERSLEEGKRSILRNSRRTREFSLSRITDFDILRGARRTNIAAEDRQAERYFDRKMLLRDPLFNSCCSVERLNSQRGVYSRNRLISSCYNRNYSRVYVEMEVHESGSQRIVRKFGERVHVFPKKVGWFEERKSVATMKKKERERKEAWYRTQRRCEGYSKNQKSSVSFERSSFVAESQSFDL